MSLFTSVADIDQIISALPLVDSVTQNKAIARQNQLTKPPGALGKLEDIAIWMAGWQRNERPDIRALKMTTTCSKATAPAEASTRSSDTGTSTKITATTGGAADEAAPPAAAAPCESLLWPSWRLELL